MLLPACTEAMMDVDSADAQPAVSKSAAETLALAASRIADRLREFEGLLRHDEATRAVEDAFAGNMPTAGHIADRLESVLQEATVATGCDAAGLYLLDADTSQLKLRSCFGLPKSRLMQPPRPLRGSLGDLEALVSPVVTIEDIPRMPHWESPEERGAAIVVAIRGGDLPLGTLWLWDDQPRDITSAQQASATLAAGRIAAELEREVIHTKSIEQTEIRDELRSASAWQSRQLPPAIPLDQDWDVSGWCEAADTVGGDWFAWDVLPDGKLAIAIASVGTSGIESALTAATARSAWQSHTGYRHKTNQVLSRVNDTLWQTSTGDQSTSLLYANVDPETGEGQFSAAGNCHGLIVNRYGYRMLTSPTKPLGHDPDVRPMVQSMRLLPGEALVLISQGALASNGSPQSGRLTQQELTDAIRRELHNGPEPALSCLRRLFAQAGKADADRSLAILQRQ
ncbi:Stage II sporulation protein E (SpoIIE) [Rosistilla carotiformis]|uniref:Stage II sporulation protein E (SpoIIE) n=2 Tax=Rosistilla carotiformis TaxID=2528017 RepID=A0A518JYX4_9BACT|nr:Stage II sporulation protein E (SpoIIE) [Rosistilla carotiformis]